MKSIAALALAALLGPAAHAEHQKFVVEPDASQVKITLNTTHEVVNGVFHVQSGSIELDRDTPAISGSIIVLSGSGNTGNNSRDKKMKNDILKVAQFANISFEPKSFTGSIAPTGDSTIQVTGIFTLLGSPHQITVPVQVRIEGSAATARARFLIPYVQWGLKNPSFLFWKCDNDVAIDLFLSSHLSN